MPSFSHGIFQDFFSLSQGQVDKGYGVFLQDVKNNVYNRRPLRLKLYFNRRNSLSSFQQSLKIGFALFHDNNFAVKNDVAGQPLQLIQLGKIVFQLFSVAASPASL